MPSSHFAAPHKYHAHPSTDVVLSPHAVPRTRSAACQPAEEDAAAGAMFAADDLPAGRTASTTLRDVRGIRTAQQVQQAGEKELSEAAASDGREVSEELPVSVSPPDAEAISIAAPAAAVPTPPAGTAEHLAEETAATPAYRSAALHRLAQIFGGLRGGPSEGRAMQGGGLTAAAAEEDEGDEEAGPLPLEAALPLSPVQKYISYRRAFAGLVWRETAAAIRLKAGRRSRCIVLLPKQPSNPDHTRFPHLQAGQAAAAQGGPASRSGG